MSNINSCRAWLRMKKPWVFLSSAGWGMAPVPMGIKLAGKMMYREGNGLIPCLTGKTYQIWVLLAADRLKQAQIECMPAIDLIRRFDYENVFMYIDPPYVLSTRE